MKQKVKIDKAVTGPTLGRRAAGGAVVDDTLSQSKGDGVGQTLLHQERTMQIGETSPTVKAIRYGFAIGWMVPGASPGAANVVIATFDEHGIPKSVAGGGTFILVTDNADPAVSPAISAFGAGFAAAYVRAHDGALVVRAFDEAGVQRGQEIVMDMGEAGAISEIAVGSQESKNANFVDQLAVVYIRDNGDGNGSSPEYGDIMLQRYCFPPVDGGSEQLVALGGDGQRDGADAAVHLTSEGDGDSAASEAVVGRSPDVAVLDDGSLAIIWVANDGTRETIKACTIEAEGEKVLRIDLTGLIEDAGTAKGTKPGLLTSGDGDILVSWLQHRSDDAGCVAMAALYRAVDSGDWIKPVQPIEFKELNGEPKDFSVTISGKETLFIDMAWRSGSSDKIFIQRFDVDGNGLGGAEMVAGSMSADEQLNISDLTAAGLIDGQIVVVHTEQVSNGDVYLAAQVIDAHGLDETDNNEASLVTETIFSTGVDQEIAINVLSDRTHPGSVVSHINGTSITTATPVDVGLGWVQLREDGLLTISPDVGYTGRICFDYTVTGADRTYGSHATVYVEADETPGDHTDPNSACERQQHAVRRRTQRCLRVRVGLGFPSDQSGGTNDRQTCRPPGT